MRTCLTCEEKYRRSCGACLRIFRLTLSRQLLEISQLERPLNDVSVTISTQMTLTRRIRFFPFFFFLHLRLRDYRQFSPRVFHRIIFWLTFCSPLKESWHESLRPCRPLKPNFIVTAINSGLRAWKERFSLGRWPDIPAYAEHCAYFIRRKYRSIGFE